MGEFFKGWRRKVGLVTLAMACVIACLWVRSLGVEDVFLAWTDYADSYYTSRDGSFHWDRISYASGEPMGKLNSLGYYRENHLGWETKRLPSREWITAIPRGVEWRRAGLGIQFIVAKFTDSSGVPRRRVKWVIPYAPFAVTLTALSAWLILWKPRKAKVVP